MLLRRIAWSLGFVVLTALLSCSPHSPPDPILPPLPRTAPARPFTSAIGIEFVLVPTGEVRSRYPGIDVRNKMRRPILISAHEITNAQYEKFEPKHKRSVVSPGDKHPVSNVSAEQAEAFCKWLTKADPIGRTYHLPTPQQWTYAARGGRDYCLYPWGNTIDTTKACYKAKGTRSVGSYPANKFGLYDAAGNVAEWVKSEELFPPYRLQGGAWCDEAAGLRFSMYGRAPEQGAKLDHNGLRVVCDPPPLEVTGSKRSGAR